MANLRISSTPVDLPQKPYLFDQFLVFSNQISLAMDQQNHAVWGWHGIIIKMRLFLSLILNYRIFKYGKFYCKNMKFQEISSSTCEPDLQMRTDGRQKFYTLAASVLKNLDINIVDVSSPQNTFFFYLVQAEVLTLSSRVKQMIINNFDLMDYNNAIICLFLF